ncbi:MAG: ParB/RepB/Spo0J family partition protein [Terriglobales bacterium]
MNKPASPPPPARKALGRGLNALLAPSATPLGARSAAAAPPAPHAGKEGELRQLPIEQIQPNPLQPRRHFDPVELDELAASIRAHGVLQPVLVRPSGSGFELIAGERRLRAATLAGLTHLPALVRLLADGPMLELAIIENLQRSDLNPIEQAEAFRELAQRFRLTQEEIAQKTGKDRATIANFLRLLRLDPDLVELLRSGTLSPGQARPLLALSPEAQRALGQKIAAENWSARRVEQHVAKLQTPPASPRPAPPRDPNEREAELQLSRSLGAHVTLKAGRGHRGTIELHYASLDEFQRLYDRLVHP